jgi:hypothetical protein
VKDRGPLLWALLLAGAGLADIAVTLVIGAGGGGELNPFMGGLLKAGTPAFLVVKAGVDVGGAGALYLLWPRSRIARIALPPLALAQLAAALYGLGVVVWVRLIVLR